MSRQTIWIADQHWKDINPLQCGWEQCEAGHSFGPTVRSFYLMHYVLSGRGIFSAHGTDFSLRKGQMFIIHPQELTFYKAGSQDPWQYIWIGFEADITMPAALQKSVLSMPELRSTFLRLKDAQRLSAGREQFLCSVLWEILCALQQTDHRLAQARTDYAMQAMTFLETHYMAKISIADMADQMNLDRSYLCRLFRKRVGCSPQQYLTELRLQKAMLLMSEEHCSLSDAAFYVGYSDVASFSRAFRQKYGMPPGRYCKEHGESGCMERDF